METITFDKLLLKTAFCCMASDGDIDPREVNMIKTLCEQSPILNNLSIEDEINQLISALNETGKSFIKQYFNQLKESKLTEEEELTLIDFAIKTIMADERIEYAEIKFFKIIRNNLNLSNEKILEYYPDIEQFLEEDISTTSYLDKIMQYFDLVEYPKFELINLPPSN
jgi:uncharacterized tellurite resistance protein B-like protein